ncbi:hypothetical protein B0T14DRAFT_522075 [Immersiella caudata]|uniref:C3H1-type domain-containing protein n=1 Tax=Immersiella caudata TaxID=314043 RepID=A0AA40C111_9PEZI|nr:hypothetical protein B0T14DRAFT_522075 [Immersiella caudata]
MSTETCMIFVDDSNVWIEAQKFAASGNSHMPKLQDSNRDPRLRIDIGKLVETLRRKGGQNRIQGPSFLYGSRPPPNDSVWKAWEKNKFETNIYDRALSGKEKEVDNSMSVEMTFKASELQFKSKHLAGSKGAGEKGRTIFVVITGDRDMMPAVKFVLKCGIRVELWGWKSGISQAFVDLAASDGLLSVNLLDSIFQDICFTAYRSTRKVKSVVGGKTMVLQNVQVCDEEAICDQLLNTGQLFWKTRWDGKADLCIEFPKASHMEKLIRQARQLLPDVAILSWPEYRASIANEDLADDVKTANMYELLGSASTASDENDDTNVEERLQSLALQEPKESASTKVSGNTNSNPDGYEGKGKGNAGGTIHDAHDSGYDDDVGGWKTIVNKADANKRHRRIVNQQQDCPYGLQCKKKDDCGYRHTPKERQLFQQNPNRNVGLRKTKLCLYAPNCRRGRDCLFAHTEDEATCLDCKQVGHFQGNKDKCLLRS